MSLDERVKKIQNGAKSLTWGSAPTVDNGYVFAVGHSSYKRVIKYLLVTEDLVVSELDEHNKERNSIRCHDEDEVIEKIRYSLMKWFPAK